MRLMTFAGSWVRLKGQGTKSVKMTSQGARIARAEMVESGMGDAERVRS